MGIEQQPEHETEVVVVNSTLPPVPYLSLIPSPAPSPSPNVSQNSSSAQSVST